MKCSREDMEDVHVGSADSSPCTEDHVPLLEVRVFGGYDVLLDGRPLESPTIRQRKIRELMCILALNHGQELNSDHLANSIWPRSTKEKKRNCLNSQWYAATHAVFPGKMNDNPYFDRRHGTCRLCDEHLHTDVEAVDWACNELIRRDLDSIRAVPAYQVLQAAYRGDLLPGEMENGIIIRARNDWRDRVSGSLSAAAQTMMERGDDRTALWMATVACRLAGMREDVVRLRMELFAKMGMPAYAVKAYAELEELMRREVGMDPSPQSVALMRQVVDGSGLAAAMSPHATPSRRRGKPIFDMERRGKSSFALGEALPVRSDRLFRPM